MLCVRSCAVQLLVSGYWCEMCVCVYEVVCVFVCVCGCVCELVSGYWYGCAYVQMLCVRSCVMQLLVSSYWCEVCACKVVCVVSVCVMCVCVSLVCDPGVVQSVVDWLCAAAYVQMLCVRSCVMQLLVSGYWCELCVCVREPCDV